MERQRFKLEQLHLAKQLSSGLVYVHRRSRRNDTRQTTKDWLTGFAMDRQHQRKASTFADRAVHANLTAMSVYDTLAC